MVRGSRHDNIVGDEGGFGWLLYLFSFRSFFLNGDQTREFTLIIQEGLRVREWILDYRTVLLLLASEIEIGIKIEMLASYLVGQTLNL